MGHYVIQQDNYVESVLSDSTAGMTTAYGSTTGTGTANAYMGSQAYASKFGTDYQAYEGVYQFQTSAIPTSETVISSVIRIYGVSGGSAPGAGASGLVLEAYYDSSLTFPTSTSSWRSRTAIGTLYSSNQQIATYNTWVGGVNNWNYAAYPGNSTKFNDFASTSNMNTIMNSLVPSGTPLKIVIATTKLRNNDTVGDGVLVSMGLYQSGDTNGTNAKLTVDTQTPNGGATTFLVRS